MAAGDYSTLYQWGVSSKATATSFGGPQAVAYTASGTLWGTPAEQVDAVDETRQKAERQITRAEIRIRNYPTIKPLDRLTDDLNRVWLVKNCYRGEVEIVCTVEQET